MCWCRRIDDTRRKRANLISSIHVSKIREDTMDEITTDDLHAMARRAGLDLSDDELERLFPGVNRARKQAAELRELIAAGDEPAAHFNVPGAARK
jgi:hypothetical protein